MREKTVSIIGIVIGLIVALYLAYPYLNPAFISEAISQPREEISSLYSFSYSATFYPANSSIILHVYNPMNFTVYVLSVKGPGFSSTTSVPIPPRTYGTVIVEVQNYIELVNAYIHGNLTITVTLRFLNTTLTAVGG